MTETPVICTLNCKLKPRLVRGVSQAFAASQHDSQDPSSVGRDEQLTPTRVRQPLLGNLCLDFRKFVDDKRVGDISRRVQTSQRLQRLLLTSDEHEPSRRLGEEEDEGSERDGREDLKSEWESPLKGGAKVILGAAVADKGCDEGADAGWKK